MLFLRTGDEPVISIAEPPKGPSIRLLLIIADDPPPKEILPISVCSIILFLIAGFEDVMYI